MVRPAIAPESLFMSTQTIARGQNTENTAESFGVTPVNKVKRVHERGRYDRKTVYEILDAALVCHIAYVIDGRPYCTPTSFWREGDHLYWHGSSASRMIRTQGQGVPVCLTVTHLDALVMARSGFHHSVNYRAVMAFGTAHIIDDVEKKLTLMDRFIDRIYPGRSKLIRQPNKQEFKATTMMGMEIEHASGKIRDKHVGRRGGGLRRRPGLVVALSRDPGDWRAIECERQLPGLGRPDDMADFEPGARARRADDQELPAHVRDSCAIELFRLEPRIEESLRHHVESALASGCRALQVAVLIQIHARYAASKVWSAPGYTLIVGA